MRPLNNSSYGEMWGQPGETWVASKEERLMKINI